MNTSTNITTTNRYKYPLIIATVLLSLGSLTACAKQNNTELVHSTKTTDVSTVNNDNQVNSQVGSQLDEQQALKQNYLLLDVRSQFEYSRDGLTEAVSIPYKDIEDKITAITGGDKNIPIKVHCRSGNRAGVAIETLQKMGYNNVENVHTLAGAITYLEEHPIYAK